jgi:nicotinate-nucleotide pyrophosphorylase (carboxylating)
MSGLDPSQLESVVRSALAEDLGSGDYTTQWVIPPGAVGSGSFVAKEHGILAGVPVLATVFALLDPECSLTAYLQDGAELHPGQEFARVCGPIRALLAGERTALNFLQRLSGIATLTRRYVEAVAGTKAVILDTRKTTPGLRFLEKWAVRVGGGQNHRFGLFDMILIKDNHIAAAGGIRQAVEAVRQRNDRGLLIEVEVTNRQELEEALALGVDRILLDNMSVSEIAEAVRLVAGRVPLEASGGVTLGNVRQIAETGVDFISVGALTHSAPALDMSMELA